LLLLRPSPSLFPYTTLFRSVLLDGLEDRDVDPLLGGRQDRGRVLGQGQRLVGVDADGPEARRLHRLDAAVAGGAGDRVDDVRALDRKSTRLNSSHVKISYAV